MPSRVHNPNPNQLLYCPLLGSCTLGHSSPTFITPGTATRLSENPLKCFKPANPKPAESAYPTPSILSHENHNEGSCPLFPLLPPPLTNPGASPCGPRWGAVALLFGDLQYTIFSMAIVSCPVNLIHT